MQPQIRTFLFSILTISLILINCKAKKEPSISNIKKKKVLVFTKTNGYKHKSIPYGIEAIKKLGQEKAFKVEVTEDSLQFNYQNLKKYNSIIFLNTTGNVLGTEQEKDFQKYINEGGSFVGIHSASDTEYNWPFYAEMIGAHFKSHPKQQKAKLKTYKNSNHPAVQHYTDSFEHFDEWYNFKKPVAKHVNVLLELDESSYSGNQMGAKHPIAWYHHYEGGRVFYTGMGHTIKSYENLDFLTHLKEGILWSMGETNVSINEKGIDLLDENFSKWDVWMGAVHPTVDIDFEKSKDVRKGKPMGLNNDPKKVFSVIKENGENILKITGEIYGGLTTKNEYGNYHFSTQFKWGEKKWEPRLKDKRDSGILYHAKGVHGAFWKVWMTSLEFQVQEGDCGDFIALGNVYGDVPVIQKKRENGKKYYAYDPKGELTTLKWGKEFKAGQASKSVLHENPNGEWNTLEIYCFEDESIHLVNGHVVNRVKNAKYSNAGVINSVDKGKIQIQSEAAEVYYKNMKITPITKFPSRFKKL